MSHITWDNIEEGLLLPNFAACKCDERENYCNSLSTRGQHHEKVGWKYFGSHQGNQATG